MPAVPVPVLGMGVPGETGEGPDHHAVVRQRHLHLLHRSVGRHRRAHRTLTPQSTVRLPVVTVWDVIVVGGGPAGLSAAHASATAGASTLVLERAEHPRYKTCGGGLIGSSIAALPPGLTAPVRERIDRATFTAGTARSFTRTSVGAPLVEMADRAEFDAALVD